MRPGPQDGNKGPWRFCITSKSREPKAKMYRDYKYKVTFMQTGARGVSNLIKQVVEVVVVDLFNKYLKLGLTFIMM